MTKSQIIEGLRNYFNEKGKFMTPVEYKAQPDAPYRVMLIKRCAGTWKRLEKLIGPIEPKAPVKPEPKK